MTTESKIIALGGLINGVTVPVKGPWLVCELAGSGHLDSHDRLNKTGREHVKDAPVSTFAVEKLPYFDATDLHAGILHASCSLTLLAPRMETFPGSESSPTATLLSLTTMVFKWVH
jgi:hypothetical protein